MPKPIHAFRIFFILILAFLLCLAIQNPGQMLAGLPASFVVIGCVFLVQIAAFIPAYVLRTETFYDITASLTYTAAALMASWWFASTARQAVFACCVTIWAMRLGIFLLHRVHKAGKDARFDDIKQHFFTFLIAWLLQGLWISITIAPTIVVLMHERASLVQGTILSVIGWILWALGFAIETISDWQKSTFRAQAHNQGKFMSTGLWSWSQHPNYFGEITLWLGLTISALPYLQGWQWVVVLSPMFIAYLLIRISGVPMLDAKAKTQWGNDPDYIAYTKRTSKIIPWPPTSR